MSGPISKAKDLLPQIKSYRRFDETMATQGLKWFVWGLFLKVMMADRLGMYVDKVLDNYMFNSGTSCLLAAILLFSDIWRLCRLLIHGAWRWKVDGIQSYQ